MGSEVIFRGQLLPDDISEALARAGTRLGVFQHRFQWYEQAGSTNDIAMAAAADDAPEGMVVVANAQSSGRGRLGRAWASPPGVGLYMSLVLRPPRDAMALVTLAAGAAVADGIEAASGLATSLKWPNDVYVGTRKLAGILAEAGSSSQGEHVVIGCGINVQRASLPPDVAARATSIEGELGRTVDRGLLLAECLVSLSSHYRRLQQGTYDELLTAWRVRATPHMGRRVEWDEGGGVQQGIVHDIDSRGALLVHAGDRVVRVISGEVRWLA
jgi:BirA family biotin operon repressor/biotin-[acetyl-CoA-carboxylase] ligase